MGWAAGVSTAEATAAGMTAAGVAESANTACGGDMCASEIRDGTQVTQRILPAAETALNQTAARMATTRTLGRAGETAAGIIKNTERIKSLTGTANYRIPDQLLGRPPLLSDVKNVSYLPLTNQIKDFLAYSQQEGYTFQLIVRDTTRFSQPLQEVINRGQVFLKYLELK